MYVLIQPSPEPFHHNSDNNESEYFSETLAAESLPHYQPAPAQVKESPSPTTSPYSSVDATNHVNNNNNGQNYHQTVPAPASHSNLVNNNPKYHQQTNYSGEGLQSNGNSQPLMRNNVVMSASIPSGGVSASSQIQQQLQQKYYDQYENYAKPNQSLTNSAGANGNAVNNNTLHQNGMSQTAYNGAKAYGAHPQQMTSSYNQQMAYNNHYNSHQNGSSVGKIADYDPLTDGPRRNIPQTTRPNPTLIYSSDRPARELPIQIPFRLLFCPFPHQITFVQLVQNF
jgi:hypothetical protein